MTGTRSERIFMIAFGGAVVAFMVWLATRSTGLEGGMDSYHHYVIARYSWEFPYLFLDYWGKPVYNLLASPFAQFGIPGVIALNIISLAGAALLAYGAAKRLGLKSYALVAFALTLISPIFLDNVISSLTEPLTALLVMASIYALVSDRVVLGAVIAGFLPHARSEGFIILFAVFLFMLLTKKKWYHFLYLGVGSLIFNSIGWAITGQPFWIITENPYINFELSGENICGSGGILDYFHASPYTFGKPAAILMFISALIYGLRSLKALPKWRNIDLKFGLIFTSFSLYFASHAAIWWLGKMGSCGYVRVMVVIAPLGAIMAAYSLFHMNKWLLSQWKWTGFIMPLASIALIAHALFIPYHFYEYKYPLTITPEQEQYKKLYEEWYRYQDFDDRTKLYLYPYFSILADINPYDQKEHLELWRSSLQWTKKGDILIWDGHFGPNEGQLPLDTLMSKPEWKHIHSIIPDPPMKTLNNYDFEVHVFEKIE